MMKSIKATGLIAATAAAVLLLAGCEKESNNTVENGPVAAGFTSTIAGMTSGHGSAGTDGTPATRAAGTAWTADDAIGITATHATDWREYAAGQRPLRHPRRRRQVRGRGRRGVLLHRQCRGGVSPPIIPGQRRKSWRTVSSKNVRTDATNAGARQSSRRSTSSLPPPRAAPPAPTCGCNSATA